MSGVWHATVVKLGLWGLWKRRNYILEMWCYRRMLKIKWIDKVTNEMTLQRVGEKRSLLKSIVKRRVQLTGHLMRHEGILNTIIEGYVAGKRPRGRPRLRYMDQIKEDVGCKTYEEMKRKAERHEEWRFAANLSSD